MDKVYLILRNNIQYGPFTLFELMQQQPRSTDMIWVEGKSTAWTYLSELELNMPDHPVEEKSQVISRKRPARDDIEAKAEEIRQRVLSFKPGRVFIQNDFQEPEDDYAQSFPGENEIQIINHRKENKKTSNELVMTSLIIALFAGGLYVGSNYLQTRKEIISPAAIKVTPTEKKIIPPPITVQTENSTASITSLNDSIQQKELVSTSRLQENDISNPGANPVEDSLAITGVLPPVQIQNKQEENLVAHLPVETNKIKTIKEDTAIIAEKKPVYKKKPADTTKSEMKNEPGKEVKNGDEKKKGLGKALKNLFGKKDKKTRDKDQ